MIRIEGGPDARVRIIGTLKAPVIETLLDMLWRQGLVLDLSEVDQADEKAVRTLAELPPARCRVTGCPPWLARWVKRLQERAAETDRRQGSR